MCQKRTLPDHPIGSQPKPALRNLIERLERIERPDPQFADDLEKIQAEQPLIDLEGVWNRR
jgi:hypothetical protein